MSKLLNAVVVGVGSLGKNHARIYANNPKVKLTAVVDPNENARSVVSSEWKCPGVSDIDEIAENIDIASVVVPTVSHYKVAARLIERGVSVLVEKPITLTVEEGQKLVSLARDRKVILQVGHVERFNPAVLELGKILDKPLFIESHRLGPPTPRVKDVGVIVDLMIHDLDLILSLVNSEIVYIDAVGVPILTPYEDIANARIRFASGCIANVTVSRVTLEKQRKIRFFQRNTYISLDFLVPDLQLYCKVKQKDGAITITHEHPSLTPREPLALEIDSFIQCVLEGKKPVVTGEDGVRALRVARQITDQVQQVAHTFLDDDIPMKL